MKIELDYDSKTITVKDSVNAKDLIDKLNDLKIDLKEWSLVQQVAEPYVPFPQPQRYDSPDWLQPYVHVGTDNTYPIPTTITFTTDGF